MPPFPRWEVMAVAVILLGSTVDCATAQPSTESSSWESARILAVSADGDSMSICPVEIPQPICEPEGLLTLTVAAPIRTLACQYSEGDRIRYRKTTGPPTEVTDIRAETQTTSLTTRILFFFASVMLVALLFSIPMRLAGKFPSQLLVGKDGRTSNSKVQAAAWFLVVLSAYLTMAALRLSIYGNPSIAIPSIPSNLLILAGLSGFTFGASKLITTQQIAQASTGVSAAGPGSSPDPPPDTPVLHGSSLHSASPRLLRELASWAAKPPSARASPMDLFTDDSGRVDFGDTQIVILTSLGIAVFVVLTITALRTVALVHGASLPDLDAGLVALLGISQGSYLMKKFSA